MSNTWFRFKQFAVSQDRCAMKVTTDACIQGAWTPVPVAAARVLDIGTGTGLLSLMLAQRNPPLLTDAVEYDAEAAGQATENVAASPWRENIAVTACDVKDFQAAHRYDLIICNPPFFSNSLLSGKESKDRARHDVSLTRAELATVVARHLASGGQFSILLPYTEYQLWKEAAASVGLMETRCLHVKHTPTSAVKRVVGIFSCRKQETIPAPEILVIKDGHGRYSAAFSELLGPFYLEL